MKKIVSVILCLLSFSVYCQNLEKIAKEITNEGIMLYKSEMASWYGTDLFMEAYKNRGNIEGYFSYVDGDTAKCIFFSKGQNPKVIGSITFDSTYNVSITKPDLTVKEFTPFEKDLYTIRQNALEEIRTDTIFEHYKNTSMNIIPIIKGKEKKVYILTGPSINGVVIFGNDYLLTFGPNNKVKNIKRLHKNIIPIEYGEGKPTEETIHSHLPETGDFITATDVCTLMLYEKIAGMKNHIVVSKKYMSTWNCKTNRLFIVSMDTIKKINASEEKENRKKGSN